MTLTPFFRTSSQAGFTVPSTAQIPQMQIPQIPLTTNYNFPTPIASQWTSSLRNAVSPTHSLPGVDPTNISFAQLKSAYTHENIIQDLGKLGADDPHKQSSLAYANLRENRSARRHLGGLNLARGHVYGVRAFGPKHWYENKPALARRLKTQAHRRQLRLGLKSSFEFLNQLRMRDLRATLDGGDAVALSHIALGEQATVEEFRKKLTLVSPRHILMLFAPEKMDAISNILDGVESLADFNQRLGRHLASQPALEPIHSVLCDILRSGLDFTAATAQCPLNIATEAMRHQCSTPDDDAVAFAKPAPSARSRSAQTASISWSQRRRSAKTDQTARSPSTGGARNKIKNCCFHFQKDSCSRQQCAWRHICNVCGSLDHGAFKCPNGNDQS